MIEQLPVFRLIGSSIPEAVKSWRIHWVALNRPEVCASPS